MKFLDVLVMLVISTASTSRESVTDDTKEEIVVVPAMTAT
jgi:hypothetical protein